MPRLSQRGIARELGVDAAHINRLVKKGVIEVGPDKLIDLEAARGAIAGGRSIAHGYMDEVNARQRTSRAPAARADVPDEPAEPIDSGASGNVRRQYDKARSVRESFAASLLRLEYQKKAGQLVDRAVAERVLFEAGRQARDAWLGFPSRAAPLIAAELSLDDSDALLQALAKHVHKQIESLGADAADFDDPAR